MTKILILLGVVLAVLWLLMGRRRGGGDESAAPKRAPQKSPPAQPQAMLACAHCGVHLPQNEVVAGADGRPYCSDAHRLAGPR